MCQMPANATGSSTDFRQLVPARGVARGPLVNTSRPLRGNPFRRESNRTATKLAIDAVNSGRQSFVSLPVGAIEEILRPVA